MSSSLHVQQEVERARDWLKQAGERGQLPRATDLRPTNVNTHLTEKRVCVCVCQVRLHDGSDTPTALQTASYERWIFVPEPNRSRSVAAEQQHATRGDITSGFRRVRRLNEFWTSDRKDLVSPKPPSDRPADGLYKSSTLIRMIWIYWSETPQYTWKQSDLNFWQIVWTETAKKITNQKPESIPTPHLPMCRVCVCFVCVCVRTHAKVNCTSSLLAGKWQSLHMRNVAQLFRR